MELTIDLATVIKTWKNQKLIDLVRMVREELALREPNMAICSLTGIDKYDDIYRAELKLVREALKKLKDF